MIGRFGEGFLGEAGGSLDRSGGRRLDFSFLRYGDHIDEAGRGVDDGGVAVDGTIERDDGSSVKEGGLRSGIASPGEISKGLPERGSTGGIGDLAEVVLSHHRLPVRYSLPRNDRSPAQPTSNPSANLRPRRDTPSRVSRLVVRHAQLDELVPFGRGATSGRGVINRGKKESFGSGVLLGQIA